MSVFVSSEYEIEEVVYKPVCQLPSSEPARVPVRGSIDPVFDPDYPRSHSVHDPGPVLVRLLLRVRGNHQA